MSTDPVVYLLTHSHDFYTVDKVQQSLLAEGYQAIRVDTDYYPSRFSLSVAWQYGRISHCFHAGRQTLRLDEAHAIWCRRLWPNAAPSGLSGREAQRSRQASNHAFDSVMANLADMTYCLDSAPAQKRANSKLWQLTVATKLGLPVLPSLISSHPATIQRFSQPSDQTIHKSLTAYISDYGLADDFVFTQKVSQLSAAQRQCLVHTPSIFQRYVAKHKEYRVIVLGQHTFVGSMQPVNPKAMPVDWRMASAPESVPWQRDDLPKAFLAQLVALTQALGLSYGAIDAVEDEQGQLYFLELNPTGEYGWFERDLGYPISEQIALMLITRGQHGNIDSDAQPR